MSLNNIHIITEEGIITVQMPEPPNDGASMLLKDRETGKFKILMHEDGTEPNPTTIKLMHKVIVDTINIFEFRNKTESYKMLDDYATHLGARFI